jgi:OTU domain-containing protein 3
VVFICVLYCAQAGQPELQAMATVGQVDIMVHQFEAPSYVVSGSATGKMIHVSYHDGQHYNSVHPTAAAAASLARPAATSGGGGAAAAAGTVGSDETPEGVYARAVSALQLEAAPAAPPARALAMVRSVLKDMGGDSDAAHEFLLVDPQFSEACVAAPEPEPEPEPEPAPAPSADASEQSWASAEQERFEQGLASFGKEL